MNALFLDDYLLPSAVATRVAARCLPVPRLLSAPASMPQPRELDQSEAFALAELGDTLRARRAPSAALLEQVAQALARAMAPVDEYVERTLRNLMRSAGAPRREERVVH